MRSSQIHPISIIGQRYHLHWQSLTQWNAINGIFPAIESVRGPHTRIIGKRIRARFYIPNKRNGKLNQRSNEKLKQATLFDVANGARVPGEILHKRSFMRKRLVDGVISWRKGMFEGLVTKFSPLSNVVCML